MTTLSPEPVRRSVSVPRWVFLSVLTGQLLMFATGVLLLMLFAGSMNNKFRDVALAQFQGYLTLVNAEVFLKGYLTSGLILALIAMPAVKWWLRKKNGVTRWAVMWRTALCCALVTLFLSLHLVYLRPYLLDGLSPDHWLLFLRGMVPAVVKDTILPAILSVVPWAVLIALGYYYLNGLLRRMVPAWPSRVRHVTVFAKLCAAAAVCWAIPAWNSRADLTPRVDRRPNVLIIASDSLRADHLSCNGYSRMTTPAIDALVASSVNFRKCFTPIASTVESLTTIMSSQYPHTHGLQHMFPNRQQVEKAMKDSPKLAQVLKEHGYDTAVMGDWCAGVFDMMPMGFDKVDATTFDNFKVYMSQAIYLAHPVMPLYFDNPVGYWLFPKLETNPLFVTPEVVTDRVVERLAKQTHRDKPFFWTVFYSCTHIPYTNPPQYAKKFTDPKYAGPHKHQFSFDVGSWINSVDMSKKWQAMPKADVEQIIDLYDGGVSRFDDCVKRVVEQLKATGQFENTIILVTSDHGDDLFEPNCTFGHGLCFNGGDQNNNIPAVLRVPGMEKNARNVPNIVRSLDFAPTLLDFCGIPKDHRMEGVSLKPYVEQTSKDLGLAFFGETSYLFCKRYIPGEKPLYLPPMDESTRIDDAFDCHFVLKDKYQARVLETKERVLRTERWKLVFTPGEDRSIWRLYDMDNDPHCERNVAFDNPGVFSVMEQRLRSWMYQKEESRIPDIFPRGEPPPVRPAA